MDYGKKLTDGKNRVWVFLKAPNVSQLTEEAAKIGDGYMAGTFNGTALALIHKSCNRCKPPQIQLRIIEHNDTVQPNSLTASNNPASNN